jgi:hypothetical protein
MLRRVTALLTMLAILGLLLMLVWEVELHREHGSTPDEPALVMIGSRVA